MAEKDFREKRLEDFDDVFADIINGLVFDGEHQVDENDLESGMPRSAYKVEAKFEEQERDVKKYWKAGQIRLAVFGLENQTGEDPDFIFRDFGYDGAEYRDQVRRRNEVRRNNAKLRNASTDLSSVDLEPLPDFYPVVTLVLYFGDTHWKGSLNLKDHLKEFIELMNVITNSDRFSALPKLVKERGGDTMMTILFDEAEARGKARGEAIGEARGEARGKEIGEIIGVIKIYSEEMNLSPAEIIKKIMSRFFLNQSQAEHYVETTLGLQKVSG